MHTAAHPDDEDTALIARLARGDHARVAYLSLNRGEGGQNIIGTELFDALGVIRTEELLQARTLDGGDQFFTRAYDFGFTKTPEEASAKWDDAVIVGDMVRAIRRYRPLVILNGWSGTPADGHGQHQLAGKLAPLAFAAAADPTKYPEQLAEGLRPWQARKLYVRHGFGADPGDGDPAAADRDAGPGARPHASTRSRWRGAASTSRRRWASSRPAARRRPTCDLVTNLTPASRPPARIAERSVFDGIDTSLVGLAALAGLPKGALVDRAGGDGRGRGARRWRAPTSCARRRSWCRCWRAAWPPRGRPGRRPPPCRRRPAPRRRPTSCSRIKVAEFEDALVRASGIVVDALADREVASAGDTLKVNVNVFQPDGTPVTAGASTLVVPAGWTRGAGATAAEARRRQPVRALLPRGADPDRAVAGHGRGRCAADAAVLAAHAPHRPRVHLDRRPDGAADAAVRSAAGRRARPADHRRRGRDRGAAGRLPLRRRGPRRDPPRRGDRAGGDRRLRRDAGDRADRRRGGAAAHASVSACAARRCRQGRASCACCRRTAGR